MDGVPAYVSIVFILTTFAAIAFLLRATRRAGLDTLPAKILLFLLPLWIFFQAALSISGFYENSTWIPPTLVATGVLPALLLVVLYLSVFREKYVKRLPLRTLTMLHTVRIPVELVLLWLYFAGQVPQMMTFEGRNFDILAGIAAPVVAWAGFRGGEMRPKVLIAFNIIGLVLLANVVSIAALSLPSALQMLNFEQPNRAVFYFPYVFLPTIVVPIALFAHLASLIQLFGRRDDYPAP